MLLRKTGCGGTEAVPPDFPSIMLGKLLQPTSTMIVVAADEQGHVLDASLLASSGYPVLDNAGIRSARMSSYSGSISYCQKVQGEYIFTATFFPHS